MSETYTVTDGYRQHAAPESIMVRITKAKAQRRKVDLFIEELHELLGQRETEKTAGLWPAPNPGTSRLVKQRSVTFHDIEIESSPTSPASWSPSCACGWSGEDWEDYDDATLEGEDHRRGEGV